MTSESDSPRLTPSVGPRDHSQGPAEAPVTLVQYGDFQCPYCGEAYGIVKGIQKQLGARLRFVFRNFPLTNVHPYAALAAEAAEASGAQGKFWEMHDLLYEHQSALTEPDLLRYAHELGLDTKRFASELRDHVHAQRVREDFMSGVRSGVNGTPTFYVNEVRHNGSYEPEALLEAIEAAMPSGASTGRGHARSTSPRKRTTG
ncbi:MAG: thioredoxin domain-containing protein [Thermoplasmata archaeon]